MVKNKVKYPGIPVTTNGNQLVSLFTESLIAEAGVFYPITPSTEQGENFQLNYAKGQLNAFGESTIAIETEGEHAAQGGAIAVSVTGKRVVNFTSGQGIVYGLEQYYHAPGKLSTMVLEVGARALTKHALNVHCGHDDIYAALDTGWIMLFAKDAQQAADQSIIIRKVTELSLNPGINIQDGFLTTHLERKFVRPEAELIREYLGHPSDIIDCPTEAQKELFGAKRRRVPEMMDLKNPILLGPVQNQEHYMNGIAARRNNFSEPILGFLENAYKEFGELTGREYGLVTKYNCDNSDTIFIALGSAAENIEAVSDYLKETRGVEVGVLHINVIRPFPENEVIKAVKGKKNVIILERTDDSLSPDNPLSRDIRSAIDKAVDHFLSNAYEGIETINPNTEKPKIFSGVYGLGSRDFRPEGIIGAYDFCTGKIARQDGKTINDGERFFFVGIDHPYAVISNEKPSCLPNKSTAVRFHSIGGWGMITTGKNLGEILGEISDYVAIRDNLREENGNPKTLLNISANPKYGSEKKGAPTNYFLVASPERVRVNCDLHHVNVVLCPDPKAFLHTNPLSGISEGGVFVWESKEDSPEKVWQRIPKQYRQEIIDKNIKLYALNGFKIAKAATDREDLQYRMQGNAFLGSFFKVSPILHEFNLPEEEFLNIVRKQYEKKFGKLGTSVIDSNMTIMQSGFDNLMEVPYGDVNAKDTSGMVGKLVHSCDVIKEEINYKPNVFSNRAFDAEYRSGYGYDQPASPLASVGVIAPATGKTAGKYTARRLTPVYEAQNCVQCMECITVCPDTALPNTAQDISTVLSTAINKYVSDSISKKTMLGLVSQLESLIRAEMVEQVATKEPLAFADITRKHLKALTEGNSNILAESVQQVEEILETLPISYEKVNGIFKNKEKKSAGDGGLFSIFVSDLCKGCGACVEACGDHDALKMVEETEEIHAEHLSASEFLSFLPDTNKKYLGLFNSDNVQDIKAAALKYHLMVQSNYTSLVSGDGACAGCGEKSVLRSVATLTEALMRPIYHKKADRFENKSNELMEKGLSKLEALKQNNPEAYKVFRRTVLHTMMGYGGSELKDTESRIANEFNGSDEDIVKFIAAVLKQESFNHRDLQTIEGGLHNGMSVMAMAAHTGCNTVYGSTPPANPHPYPWMNSLFQDGATIGWLMGESFIQNHSKRSVCPERFTDFLLSDDENKKFTEDDYFKYTHFNDAYMTEQEIIELPKVWVIGGDGGMGDIGFQNVSKVVLQNRPNVKLLMLDTQVYSNTGGQNSDSSFMPGGFDMNQFGKATEGKITERKSVAHAFLGGHGSPFVAQGSMGNSAGLYKAVVDALCYRGTAFLQTYTSCQPEHGIPDYASEEQAMKARDCRVFPEFVFNPELGEFYTESLSVKANPNHDKDWFMKNIPGTTEKYAYTPAHWALTEARFKNHIKKVKEENCESLESLDDVLKKLNMNDVIHRKILDEKDPKFVQDFGVYFIDYKSDGKKEFYTVSRQMVAFCIERRKAWRALQSMAGVKNTDYLVEK